MVSFAEETFGGLDVLVKQRGRHATRARVGPVEARRRVDRDRRKLLTARR
jgi:cell division protein FtsN